MNKLSPQACMDWYLGYLLDLSTGKSLVIGLPMLILFSLFIPITILADVILVLIGMERFLD